MAESSPSITAVSTSRRRWPWILAGIALLAVAVLWELKTLSAERSLLVADPDTALRDAGLMAMAASSGRAAFQVNCQGCHGAGGTGNPGFGAPNLTDADWLYGVGLPSEIERIVAYGVRSNHPKSWNLAVMPAYGRAPGAGGNAPEPLTPSEVSDLVEYLASLQGDSADTAAAARGHAVYNDRGGCFDCHSRDAGGDPSVGAPNLKDRVWLYGDGNREQLRRSIADGHQGVCPSFIGSLSPMQIRAVALYVSSLSQPQQVK
ncbi:MAG: c-type cytochrome [Rhodospirillaceae bacterium]|nr:c-type cytochrome [Rhodospirillaceae bacterium]